MASHLNAHNMPSPAPVADDSAKIVHKSKRWLWIVIGLVAFFMLDRASLLFVPAQYRSVADSDRYHTLYYSLKFQRFDKVKDKLETVILGDSRARHGIDPMLFAGQSEDSEITAFNFAPASSGIVFTDLIVREYLCELPNIRTIVWGVSPRIFNRYWQDPVYELFQESEGYIKDQLENEKGFSRAGMKAAVRLGFERTLSTISATVAHRSILKAVFLDALTGKDSGDHFKEERLIPVSDWGFMEFPEWQRVEMADPCEIGEILESLKLGRFKLDRDRLEQFCKLIGFLQERDIRLICFVPPMHHSLLRSGAADADGMPDADYVQLMNELQALESKFGNYRFVDFHKAGDNGFTDAEYGDYDHLNFEGSRRFSMTLAETIEQFSSDTTGPNDTFVPDSTNTSSNDTNQGTTDTTVSDNNKPANGDGDVEGPEIESHLGEDDYMIGAFPPDNRPLIWAEYEDDESGIDIKSVRMFMDGKDITADCRVREGKISFKPAKTLKAPKLYEFKVIVYDKAGNSTELVWEILLKRC